MPGYKRKRGKDAWYLEVTIGTDFTGKPIRFSKTVHCKSEAAAEKELARFYVECEDGNVSRQDKTKLSAFADLWYEDFARRYHKATTLRSDHTAINRWIKPVIGNRKIATLSRMDVQNWINHISDSNLSPKTVRNAYSVLRQIMKYAVDMGVVSDSPCQNIRLPKLEKHEAKYYNKEQVEILLRGLQALPESSLVYKCAVYLFLFGGLRRGEALGLDWDAVDFDAKSIRICKERVAGRDGMTEDSPKTSRSTRTIKLPAEIFKYLKRLRLQQKERQLMLGPKYAVSNAVLQNDMGEPLHPSLLYRWYRTFTDSVGLPHIRLHDLRHTHASMLAYMKTDKMQISERLGHSQLSTTMNIYTHLFLDADQQIADDLSDVYFKTK